MDEAQQRRINWAKQRHLEREDPELARFYRMSCADSQWPRLSKKLAARVVNDARDIDYAP